MRSSAFLLRLGTVGVLLAGLAAGPVQAATAHAAAIAATVTAWGVTITPPTYIGPCNETPHGLSLTVSGKITVSEPMTVKYVWVNQQNLPWPGPEPVSVTFHAPGTQTVVHGFVRTTSLRSSMRLRIIDPPYVPDSLAAGANTVCVQPTLSNVNIERADEGEECGLGGQPAVFTLSAMLAVAGGPVFLDYRWYRKSNETRNQWSYISGGSTSFTATGAQEKIIFSPYSTNRSESGYFKVELSSPYQGSAQTTFFVTCRTKNDL
ncbi:hypothetical protein Acor_65280 [Acrocarpospora corrugata]|uniref:Ig-like domain-containing protein n=1 Tax=Acrocarpospora corrugata TaxID=35763 RepID=A0A5M3W889_9ACTN|nr:hypothetical protein [Acrocarpospora corrugata]GES04460.1 hypothetical protein Acor_65280 [Acrocarpospora corrugata]